MSAALPPDDDQIDVERLYAACDHVQRELHRYMAKLDRSDATPMERRLLLRAACRSESRLGFYVEDLYLVLSGIADRLDTTRKV
jgi:hypothetical protein